ncbi:MAG: hypothetical protein PHD22_12885, partial [Zoogloea sp.]|nr:hypothetical protein [Zoogloea sp.]
MALAGRHRRSLGFALAVSVVAHLVILLAPAWQLPTEQASVLPPLSARLAPLPPPGLQPPPAERPVLGEAPPPRPRPRKPAPVAEPAPASGPAPLASVPEAAGGLAAENDPAPVEPDGATAPASPGGPPAPDVQAPAGPQIAELWLASGRIQYDVIRGEQNFVIGRTTHAWSHDKVRYSMETVIETAGLVGLIKPFRMVQRSEG